MELRPGLCLALLLALAGCGGAGATGGGSDGGDTQGDGGEVNTASCADPATACGDRCVDLHNDPANCGDCKHACSTAHVDHALCLEGSCAWDECSTGYADCDNDASNGCETPTANDVNNCGGCGIVCAPDHGTAAKCTGGMCGYTQCATGFGDCDNDASNGCETDLTSDDNNCGHCNNPCGSGNLCAAGVCGVACASGLTTCGTGATSYCTLTDDDPDNCGSCGHVCNPGHVDNKACAAGDCTYHQCDSLWGDCDGNPANGCETCLSCTTLNCGGCGFTCEAVHTTDLACDDLGKCAWTTCANGWGDCDPSTANGCETDILHDDAHCGPSCMPCRIPGQHCNNGTCS